MEGTMGGTMGFLGLLVVLLLGLLLIGGIVAVVALLANPRTRAAGAVLLAIGLVVVVGGVLLLGFSLALPAVQRSKSLSRAEIARMEATRRHQEEMARQSAEMNAQTAEQFQRTFEGEMQPSPAAPAEQPSPPAPAEQPAPPGGKAEAPLAPAPKAEGQPEAAPPPADPSAAPSGDTDASSEAKEATAKQAEPSAAEKRPAWVDHLPQGQGGVYQVAIKTDPRPTQKECESELPAVLRDAVRRYAEIQLDRSSEVAQEVQLPLTYIQDHIVKQKWPEPVQISLGKWVRLHALLEFDQEAGQQIQKECEQAQRRLDQQWQQASVLRRLWYGGTGLAAVLALLSLLFACLKIDQATAGARRGRLFLAGSAGILVVAGATCFVAYFLAQHPVGTEVTSPAVPQIEPAAYSVFDFGSPQPAAAVILHPAKLTVLSIGLLLLGTLAVALTISRKARPIGLALLALLLLGGLAVVLAVASSHMSVGRVELLVIAVVVVLPVCVLYAVVAFAWRTRRRNAVVETPVGERADVGVGQP